MLNSSIAHDYFQVCTFADLPYADPVAPLHSP